jgi:hypothetical protein
MMFVAVVQVISQIMIALVAWISLNYLRLNPPKTPYNWLGTWQ